MKEAILLNMKHDMGKLAEATHNTIRDIVNMNTMLQGILKTVQKMPGYKEAIDQLLAEQTALPAQEPESKLEL